MCLSALAGVEHKDLERRSMNDALMDLLGLTDALLLDFLQPLPEHTQELLCQLPSSEEEREKIIDSTIFANLNTILSKTKNILTGPTLTYFFAAYTTT